MWLTSATKARRSAVEAPSNSTLRATDPMAALETSRAANTWPKPPAAMNRSIRHRSPMTRPTSTARSVMAPSSPRSREGAISAPAHPAPVVDVPALVGDPVA